MMCRLQSQGCHNINIVTPSHIVPQLLSSTGMAAERGLAIPLVYNSGGYDSLETLRLLDGVVDIYMPDFKFWKPETAQEVLPENLAGSDLILPWIAEDISGNSYVNIMDQYHWPTSGLPPSHCKEKPEYGALLRPITGKEYADAIGSAKTPGLPRGF
mgnify:CR=1 FL=1